jgi:hypothetical protein
MESHPNFPHTASVQSFEDEDDRQRFFASMICSDGYLTIMSHLSPPAALKFLYDTVVWIHSIPLRPPKPGVVSVVCKVKYVDSKDK